VRDIRVHDARHTAATVLLLLGVPERTAMALMGWSHSAMAARYQHLTAAIQADVAERVGGLLWGATECHEAGASPRGTLAGAGRQGVSEGGRLSWCTLDWI
jgi:integrase